MDAEGLDDELMQRFARWTNLSETTFVLPPRDPAADYRLRIFTPVAELPFAGHPTLGSCHAWLEAGGTPREHDVVVQECALGLVPVRRTPDGLAFAAPPLIRSGPVDEARIAHVATVLGIDRTAIVDITWADNGPGWVAVLLGSAEEVLALRPGFVDLDLGVVGPCPPGSPEAFEVRAFFPVEGATREDPATGSLNGALAEADHSPVGDVEGREQAGDAVMIDRPVVVMGAPLGHAGHHRQHGLGPVERLDLGLLVHAQHDRPFGLSRPGARCRRFRRSVSPGRSPNPACASPRTGLSTAAAVRRCWRRPRGWGSCCPGSDTE